MVLDQGGILMKTYPKIMTLFNRTEKGTIIPDEYSDPVFEYLLHNEWLATEKIDGTNVRVGYTPSFGVQFGGRTDKAQMPVTLLDKLIYLFPRSLLERVFPDADNEIGITLYGEGYGAGIQNGGWYIPDGVDFILFDVKVGHWWLQFDDVEEVAAKLGISAVPRVAQFTLKKAVYFMHGPPLASLVAHERDHIMEGLVLRPVVDDLQKRSGQRIITKLKYKDFAKLREGS
jgi:hypothetical protein